MKLGNLNIILFIFLFFFNLAHLNAQEKINLQDLQPTYEEEPEVNESIKREEPSKIRSKEKGHPCHYEQIGDRYVVYRSSDRKVMKSINYFAPNLEQFFNRETTSEDFDNQPFAD